MREVERRLSRLETTARPAVRACDRDGLYARLFAAAGGDDLADRFARDVVEHLAAPGTCPARAIALSVIRTGAEVADRLFN